MKLLVIVRHGESVTNALKDGHLFFPDAGTRRPVDGVPDREIALTPYGIRQAELTGQALAERFGTFDIAYHSGYRRARDTLTHILGQFDDSMRWNIGVREDESIRERDPGYLYNITVGEAVSRFPWLRDYRRTVGNFFMVPPGGESLADIAKWRARYFCERLFREHPNGRVLVVTHGGTLRCLRIVLESLEYRMPSGRSPKNCGVTVYERDDAGILTLREYNVVHY